MIRVDNLTKTYEDPDGGEVPAVKDATLSCAAGEIYGLLGPNGAGKTTTLRCLATILVPTSGTATIAGHDLIQEPEAVRRSIGFLSASTGLYARLTPRETLRFFARSTVWPMARSRNESKARSSSSTSPNTLIVQTIGFRRA